MSAWEHLPGPVSPERLALRQMKRALIAFRGRLDVELRPHGITTAQLQMLHAISLAPGGSGAEIARLCHITPQTAQGLLARALRQGWIRRGKDPRNDRLVTAVLTPAGRRLVREADRIAQTIEAGMWAGIDPAETAALNQLLGRLLNQLGEPG